MPFEYGSGLRKFGPVFFIPTVSCGFAPFSLGWCLSQFGFAPVWLTFAPRHSTIEACFGHYKISFDELKSRAGAAAERVPGVLATWMVNRYHLFNALVVGDVQDVV